MMSPILAAAPAPIPAFMAGGSTAPPPVKRVFFGTEVSVGENLLEVATDDGFIMTPVSKESEIRPPIKGEVVLTDLMEGGVS